MCPQEKMKKVIVVESAAKTKTIRRFLRGEYDVIASGGHIVDLPENDLGIGVDNKFSYTVVPIESRGRNPVEYLRNKLRNADEIYLAPDPDRDGEAIAADILDHCIPEGVPVQRIEFNAIVYYAVKEALESPRDIDQDRVQAQRARRSLDRLIGFILSSMAKFDEDGPGLPSVGRVIAPAVSLVVDRENERAAFIRREYWTICALLEYKDEELTAAIKGEWDDFEDAKQVVEKINSTSDMIVRDCTEDPDDRLNPLPPFSTDTLQNEADRLLGFSPEKTMKLAQQLYQGVEIDGKPYGLITYMRTDSTRVSPTAISLAKKAISEREDLGEEIYQGRPWIPKGAVQDAHEAIRPTMPKDLDISPESLAGKLKEGVFKLYSLIYFRFLASQMKPAVYHTVKLTLEANGLKAEAEGNRLLSEGFLKIYRNIQPDHGWKEANIPFIRKGTRLPVMRAWPEKQETAPPYRHREGSLVSALKEKGIGRPSTYSTTLEKIKDYRYVEKIGRTLKPTNRGKALCDYLNQKYGNVISYEYTARMEEGLSEIERGSSTYEQFLVREFNWLREPYETAFRKGCLDGDKPSSAQKEFLRKLAGELEMDIPEAVFVSKKETGIWIHKLIKIKAKMPGEFKLSDIQKVDVRGVTCYRVQLFYTPPLTNEDRDFFRQNRMRYRRPEGGNLPCYQYQRQDRDQIEKLRDLLTERFQL
jgi:DNA topoisomerase-1